MQGPCASLLCTVGSFRKEGGGPWRKVYLHKFVQMELKVQLFDNQGSKYRYNLILVPIHQYNLREQGNDLNDFVVEQYTH